jgi:hypothetical protein
LRLDTVFLTVFGQAVRIDFDDPSVERLLDACYSAFRTHDAPEHTDIALTVRRLDRPHAWRLHDGESAFRCDKVSDLVYFIEKGMTLALQKRVPDFYFVHSAAVGLDGGCTLLVGESGVGKSTLCWNLCNRGFSYLSDELAPVHPRTLRVQPYPHAICLKSDSPGSHPLPAEILKTEATVHIPVGQLPAPVAAGPMRMRNIIFLTHGRNDGEPVVEEISRSEGAARLYANSLNPLAHERDGLAAASRLASAVNCFHVERTGVQAMTDIVRDLVAATSAQAP